MYILCTGAEAAPVHPRPLHYVHSIVADVEISWSVDIDACMHLYYERVDTCTPVHIHEETYVHKYACVRCLTQLLLYYTRFLDIIKKYCADSGALSGRMVNIPSIIAEIKKYARTF